MVIAEIALRENDWKLRGACRDADPELMWPHSSEDARIPEAKKLCASCTIVTECLAKAERLGIWGGLTEWERRAQ